MRWARPQIQGICPQERLTRVRGAGFNSTGLPDEALDQLLRRAGRGRDDAAVHAPADTGPRSPRVKAVRLDYHLAHAYSAFLPSSFEAATIVVCDHESLCRGAAGV